MRRPLGKTSIEACYPLRSIILANISHTNKIEDMRACCVLCCRNMTHPQFSAHGHISPRIFPSTTLTGPRSQEKKEAAASASYWTLHGVWHCQSCPIPAPPALNVWWSSANHSTFSGSSPLSSWPQSTFLLRQTSSWQLKNWVPWSTGTN